MADPYSAFSNEIYAAGLGGHPPDLPVTPDGLQRRARERLGAESYGYVAGGAGAEATVAANRAAFERWRIVPRMLRDVAERSLRVRVLGRELPAPVLLAPIGVQSIVHPDGELAAARAAASLGLPFVLSTASSHAFEEIAAEMGDAPRWYQLYWPRSPELAKSFLERAEASGYEALVVTLDTPILAWRPRDLENAYLPFLRGEGIANYLTDPVFRAGLAKPPEEDLFGAVAHFGANFGNPTLTWDDLGFLREHTRLPILLKGVLHADDARHAVDAGMDGVIVSNHGGRQVDGAVAALEALPGVVDAIGGRATVLFDSGIRTGADALKALALGAQAVLLGRPYVWGLGCAGEAGVRHVLRCLLADLELALALSGHASVGEVGPESLATG